MSMHVGLKYKQKLAGIMSTSGFVCFLSSILSSSSFISLHFPSFPFISCNFLALCAGICCWRVNTRACSAMRTVTRLSLLTTAVPIRCEVSLQRSACFVIV